MASNRVVGLDLGALADIAHIQLVHVKNLLGRRDVTLALKQPATDLFVREGYDPT